MTIVLEGAAIALGSGSLPMAEGDPDPFRPVLWSGVLIVVLVVLFLVVSAIRRWLKKDEEPSGGGFTLPDLRALHRQGKMTDEEFERAKALLIGQTRRDAARALEAKNKRGLDDLGSRTGSAEDLALFARALKEKAAREQETTGHPPTASPPAGAPGEE